MVVINELKQSELYDMPRKELITKLSDIKNSYQVEIDKLREKIKQYEHKKIAEEALYQSRSTLRKFFTARSPSHHLAVEYIVHVKERLKEIERIKNKIREIDAMTNMLLREDINNEFVFSSNIMEELINNR